MVGVLAQKWIKAEKAKKQKDKCCREILKTEKVSDNLIQTSSDKSISD